MLLHDLFSRPRESFMYLERYVNDGSPSGFNTDMPTQFCPFTGPERFALPIFSLPWDAVTRFGDLSRLGWTRRLLSEGRMPIPVHPHIVTDLQRLRLLPEEPDFTVDVVPTASGRTVIMDWSEAEGLSFAKLHYPRMLGRFVRGMPLFKWVAGQESSRFMRAFLMGNQECVGMFDEFAGLYVEDRHPQGGFGTIFRRTPPVTMIDDERALVPAFALFARDRGHHEDPPLLTQLIHDRHLTLGDLTNQFVRPLIGAYVALATTGGLMPECNAQNVAFCISTTGNGAGIFFRDMEDVWKDLSQRTSAGLDATCVNYHTIQLGVDPDYYQRRSFMYDFKLGEYLLSPLAAAASSALGVSQDLVLREMRDVGRCTWRGHEQYFQPRDSWFCYSRTLGVSRARYDELSDPRFR